MFSIEFKYLNETKLENLNEPDRVSLNTARHSLQTALKMLNELNMGEGRITIITDGKKGAYAFDGKKYYQCGEFPASVVSTLGAGDAFSSTFVASIIKTGGNVEQSLKNASVVAASVVEHFSAQGGFIPFEEIENRLNKHPEFKVRIL